MMCCAWKIEKGRGEGEKKMKKNTSGNEMHLSRDLGNSSETWVGTI